MTKRLLDRQISLLAYLTSSDAIFGETDAVLLDPALQGIDRGLLRIEARFSHRKRLDKIIAVFPRTIELLGPSKDAIIRGFVETCPPADIGRFENARQFVAFLSGRWRHETPIPRYLPDVAACEFACAKARVATDAASAVMTSNLTARAIRRNPGVVLHRAAFDIRTIFEAGRNRTEPIERDTPLAVTVSQTGEPRMLNLPPEVFDLLVALDGWIDAAQLDAFPDAPSLIEDLLEAGMLEARD
jgi:hypothetical protein